MDGAVVPTPDGIGRWYDLGGQLPGDGGSPQPFADVHVKDVADDFDLSLHRLRPAVLTEAVAVGDVVDRDAALLGGAALAH